MYKGTAMNRTKKGIKTRNRTRICRGIATFVAALMAATPAWAGSLVIEGAQVSSGVANSVTVDNATLIIQTGTGSGTLSTDNATAFVASSTGSAVHMQGLITIDNATTLETLYLFGGSSGTTVTLKDNLTIENTITAENYNKHYVATSTSSNYGVIHQNMSASSTSPTYFPVATDGGISRAFSLWGSTGNIIVYANPASLVFKDLSGAARNLKATGLVTNFSNSDNVSVTANGTASLSYSKLLDADSVAPTVSSFSIVDAGSDNLTVDAKLEITFSATDAFGISGYLLTESSDVPKASSFTTIATLDTSISNGKYSYTVTSGGGKTLYFYLRDSAGNISVSKTDSILVDLAPPTVTDTSIAFASGDKTTSNTATKLTLAATDDTGVTGYFLSQNASSQPVKTQFTAVTSAKSYSATVDYNLLNAPGDQTVYAWFTDVAGKVSSPKSASIKYVPTGNTTTPVTTPAQGTTTIAENQAIADGEIKTNTIGGKEIKSSSVANADGVTKNIAHEFGGKKKETKVPLGATSEQLANDPNDLAKTTHKVGNTESVVAEQKDGKRRAELKFKGADGVERTTKVVASEDATMEVQSDGTTLIKEPKKGSGATAVSSETTIKPDGSAKQTDTTGEGADATVESKEVPAGSQMTATENVKKIIMPIPPGVTMAEPPSITQPAAGGGSTKATFGSVTKADGTKTKPMVSPKKGAGVKKLDISLVGNIYKQIAEVGSTGAASRSSSATTTGTFVGRYEGKQVLIYPKAGAKYQISRDITKDTSELTLVSGDATIDYGNMKGSSMGNAAYPITNDAIVLSLSKGNNYQGVGVTSTINAADMPVDFAGTHSVWTYKNDNGTGSWLAFSDNSTTQAALSAATGVDALSSGTTPTTGLFIYSMAADELNLADAVDMSLESELKTKTLASGWHLLATGNQDDTPAELMAANSKIESVWVQNGSSWKVYATKSDLASQITSKGYTTLGADEKLSSTGSIWVHLSSNTSRSANRLIAPPSN
jgi:hypothetical protein